MNNPKIPSEWIHAEAERLVIDRTGYRTNWGDYLDLATRNFLDLLHSQGKLSMPDLPSNN